MALPRPADSRLIPGEGTSVRSLWNDYLVKIPAEDKEELWVDGAGSTEINDGTEYHLWGVGIDWRGDGEYSYGSNDDAYPESRPEKMVKTASLVRTSRDYSPCGYVSGTTSETRSLS